MKRNVLVISIVFVMVLIGLAVPRFLPRQYYRYGNGTVYLVDNPNAVWNGLWRAPVLQFEVPLFTSAGSWAPSPEQIRHELARSYPDLSEDQVTHIIRACVPCGSSRR